MSLIQINPLNKKQALGILLQAFRRNPNITWMARGRSRKYIRGICLHCLDLAISRGGAFLSSDRKGVVLVYQRGGAFNPVQKVYEILLYFRLLLTSLRVFGLWSIVSQQQKIAQYSPSEPHLYCLILAVSEQDRALNTVIELRNFLFRLSAEKGLPIYAQTSLERNRKLFEHSGFQTYQTLENKAGKYQLHMLVKPCNDAFSRRIVRHTRMQ